MSDNTTIGIEKQARTTSSKWIRRGGLAAIAGGILWATWPAGPMLLGDGAPAETGTIGLLGRIWAVYSVIPLALLIIGLVGLHRLHKGHYGRWGTAGFALSFGALGLMMVGLVSDGFAYGTIISDIGHMVFLIGFLLSIIGSLVLGFAIRRAKLLSQARTIGPAFGIAVPAGIAVAITGSILAPLGGDLWFWFAIMGPYSLAWIALGYDLHTTTRSVSAVSEPMTA